MENTQETKLCKHCQTEISKKAKVSLIVERNRGELENGLRLLLV